MTVISTLAKENVKAETTDGEEIVFSYSTRAGNKKESISLEAKHFAQLYSIVLALGQLHPELIA